MGSRRGLVGSQRDRNVDPPAALAAADPDPDERLEQRVSQVALLDYGVEDLLGDHQDERCRRGLFQCLLQAGRLQQPESGVDVVTVEAVRVLVDLACVYYSPQPQPAAVPGSPRRCAR